MNSEIIKTLEGNILVVDDNLINRLVLKKLFKKWGLKTEQAENGQEALDKLHDGIFNLVIMDIHMPVLNGMETAMQIRKNPDPRIANIPLIALTATILNEDLSALYKVGFQDYIIQPFDHFHLYQLINHYLEIHPETSNSI